MLKTINSDGSLKISLIGSAVPAGAIYNGGLAYAPDGSLYVKLTQGALSGQTYNGGLACTPDGALYVANSTPAASATFRRGLLCRADGAVHVSDATVATVRHDGGVPKDNAGRLFVGIPLSGLAASFDANTGITSSGGFASAWADQSGNGRNLLQATGANQPIHLPVGAITSGTAAAGSTGTTLNLAASALAVNDVYNDMTVAITGGTGSGQSRTITDYVGATKIATVAAWSVTPDNTSTYTITATRASVFFDGVAHYMKCAAFTLNQPETVYLVAKQVTWTSGDYVFDGNAANSMALLQSGVSPQLVPYAGGAVSANSNLTVGSVGVIACLFNGAQSLLAINNSAATTGDVGGGNAGGFSLPIDGGSSFPANIQVYEALIYNVAHDAATRANIIRALMAKWGIA